MNILNIDENELPIEWENFESKGLGDIKDKINEMAPKYLECKAKICKLNDACVLDELTKQEIYVQRVTIAANYEIFSPRQLKLFCWVK